MGWIPRTTSWFTSCSLVGVVAGCAADDVAGDAAGGLATDVVVSDTADSQSGLTDTSMASDSGSARSDIEAPDTSVQDTTPSDAQEDIEGSTCPRP